MMRIGLVFLILALSLCARSQDLFSFSKDTVLMGSSFTFTALTKESGDAEKAVNEGIKEVVRIEKLISSWDPKSQTSAINSEAGRSPVKVDKELINLIERSIKISEISNGYFDISFASMDKVWDFNNQEIKTLPSEKDIKQSVSKIDFKKILINKELNTVYLQKKGMKIGFGAIGKGYAADCAKRKMQTFKAKSGVVNAGGDLLTWGKQETGKPWSIAIAKPNDKKSVLAWLEISDLAIVTSGNYEKFFIHNEKRYCHIIDPKTGWPVSGIKSVTIISKTAELGDALATTTFILGPTEGMALINHLDGVEALIVNDKDEIKYSANLASKYFQKRP